MYELIQVAKQTFYVQSPSKIGIYKINDSDVCLIDSGNNKDAAKKAKSIIDEKNWHLTAIYNTHSHADHIGGNKYLQSQTNCKIYAPKAECAFTRHTILEPSVLYGGFPFEELRHKFLMAPESDAEYLTPSVLPDGFEIIDLPGHSFNMAGFRTPDDVVFLADCLSSKEILDKYKIGLIFDIKSYIETLEKVKSLSASVFVPSHAETTDNISPLAQYNIDKVYEISENILSLCNTPISFENILQKLFSDYGLNMTYEQYVIVGSTVRSYISWLKASGKIEVFFDNNIMKYQKL